MKSLGRALFLTTLLLPSGILAQHHETKGEIENTVAIMSNEVIQARMKALGYTNVKVDRKQELQYHIDAMKDGKLYKIEHRIVVDGTSIKWLAIHAQVFCDDLTNRTMLVGGPDWL